MWGMCDKCGKTKLTLHRIDDGVIDDACYYNDDEEYEDIYEDVSYWCEDCIKTYPNLMLTDDEKEYLIREVWRVSSTLKSWRWTPLWKPYRTYIGSNDDPDEPDEIAFSKQSKARQKVLTVWKRY